MVSNSAWAARVLMAEYLSLLTSMITGANPSDRIPVKAIGVAKSVDEFVALERSEHGGSLRAVRRTARPEWRG